MYVSHNFMNNIVINVHIITKTYLIDKIMTFSAFEPKCTLHVTLNGISQLHINSLDAIVDR